MNELVTLAEARAHLRLDEPDSDGGPDDLWLQTFIPAVSEAVLGWLKVPARAYEPEVDSNDDPILDSNGDPVPAEPLVVKFAVRAAVLIELASQFRFREGESTDNVVTPDAGHGYALNKVSTSLLTSLRKPTVA